MIIELMIYMTAVSLLLGLAALATERAFALAGWSLRWVWAVAMVISLAGPATILLSPHSSAKTSSGGTSAVRTIPASQGMPFPQFHLEAESLRVRGPAAVPIWPLLETCARWSWLAASILLLGVYFLGALHLAKIRRTWPQQSVGKYQVLVSKDIGPAVFGVVRSMIVVPRWLLNQPGQTRDAAVTHEIQHLAARDPALLLTGLLLLALTPWNLPLWWQLRRLRLAIEVDCDARVLGTGVDRRLYANTLLCVNQFAGKMPVGAVAIVGRTSQIERRIQAMMTARPRQTHLWILGFTAVAFPLVVLAAELNPPSSAPTVAPPHERSAHLGIGLADLDVNAGAASITAFRHGAIVTSVNPGGVADQAGLKRGDLIIEFGDTVVFSARALATAVSHTAPDARVPLVIQRGSENQTLMADFSTAPPPKPPSTQIVDSSDWDSLRDANLSISQPQLRDELIRIAKLDELQSLFQKESARKPPLPPDTSAISVGPRMEPGTGEANVQRLREIIAQYGWPTVSMVGVRGSTAAAMIAIGARNDPAFQAQVLGLMEPLLQRDEVPTMYYASIFDAVHTPQRFGMMGECVNGLMQPSKPVEDPQHLEERRAALGLPKIPKFCISATGAKGTS